MGSSLFKFHKLNPDGVAKAKAIQELFDVHLEMLNKIITLNGREHSLMLTKLEQACFYAKKAMAIDPSNNEGEA